MMVAMMALSFVSTLGGVFCRGYWSYAFTRLLTGIAAQVTNQPITSNFQCIFSLRVFSSWDSVCLWKLLGARKKFLL